MPQVVRQETIVFAARQAAFSAKNVQKFGVVIRLCRCRKNCKRAQRESAAQKGNLTQRKASHAMTVPSSEPVTKMRSETGRN
ncbi:hypothetical protein AD937_12775 [Gluconobacter japonicus]|nr:hypothetical protein AD937_12775 [Gluconobacter japonicus]